MSSASSPGSVTLFFEIREHNSPFRKGSRGVGVCVEPGAVTEVKRGEKKITLNGKEIQGKIQDYIASKFGFEGELNTKIFLPISQGFGMSGAIALSTALAIAKEMGKDERMARKIAHEAEVTLGTGLGDVASEITGGMNVRLKEGIPPYGEVETIPYEGEIKLVVFGDKIETKSIITSEEWKRRIKKLGEESMNKFLKEKTMENALIIAREFSFSLGLMSPQLREFLEKCENATQALLGNSAIVFGDCNIKGGKEYRVRIGNKAMILE